MRSAHTPGPWLYRGKSYAVYTAPTGPVYQYGSQIFRFNDDDEPNDADLNLILAAPDLLEALLGVLRIADRATVEFDSARAAIKKATGSAS